MRPTAQLDLQAEVTLPPELRFDARVPRGSRGPARILLTGATGFLGTHLLSELLQRTSMEVVCLVRPAAEASASDGTFSGGTSRERLRRALALYQRWDASSEARFQVLEGDLALPRLGLTEAQFDALAGSIDLIVHNGAQVNIVLPYASAKAANVLGTTEILRLASRAGACPVHYISTLGTFFASGAARVDEHELPQAVFQRNGYQQSKFVAEGLIRLAQERGLSASIYRAVRILGDQSSGIIGNLDDFLFMILQASIQLGVYPEADGTINFIPVDYARAAIVHIVQRAPDQSRVYHLAHQNPVTWRGLFEQVHSLGYTLQGAPLERWWEHIEAEAGRQGPRSVFGVLRLLQRIPNNIFAPKPGFGDDNTRQALEGSGIQCPPITQALLSTYFRFFAQAGLVPWPPALSRTGDELAPDGGK